MIVYMYLSYKCLVQTKHRNILQTFNVAFKKDMLLFYVCHSVKRSVEQPEIWCFVINDIVSLIFSTTSTNCNFEIPILHYVFGGQWGENIISIPAIISLGTHNTTRFTPEPVILCQSKLLLKNSNTETWKYWVNVCHTCLHELLCQCPKQCFILIKNQRISKSKNYFKKILMVSF